MSAAARALTTAAVVAAVAGAVTSEEVGGAGNGGEAAAARLPGVHMILIGAGSLGSTFAHEVAKRSFALKRTVRMTIVDDDKVSERNCASQEFTPVHIDRPKAEVVAEYVNQFPTANAIPVVERLTMENAERLIVGDEYTMLVDMVDNVPTRQLIATLGAAFDIPVLHAGMSQMGNGQVTWNYQTFDTFPFSVQNMTPGQWLEMADTLAESEKATDAAAAEEVVNAAAGVVELPPCELAGKRPLILNTSIAAVNAAFTFMGQDVTKDLQDLTKGQPFVGLMSCWETTGQSISVELKERGRIGAAPWGAEKIARGGQPVCPLKQQSQPQTSQALESAPAPSAEETAADVPTTNNEEAHRG